MKIPEGQIVIGWRGRKGEKIEIIEPEIIYNAKGAFKDDSLDDLYEALTKVKKRYEKLPE